MLTFDTEAFPLTRGVSLRFLTASLCYLDTGIDWEVFISVLTFDTEAFPLTRRVSVGVLSADHTAGDP